MVQNRVKSEIFAGTPAELRPNFDRWLEARLAGLSDVRRQKVQEFVEDMRIAKFSPYTIKANIQAVLTLGPDGKAYEALTREELIEWMRQVDSNGYSPETIQSYRKRVKHFLRWVHGARTMMDPTPEPLKCIRIPNIQRELPKGVLSASEIQRILAACPSLRNRALVHVGYEGGCRAGELLGMKIKDVEFDRHGAVIVVRGKTGARRIRLIESVHDLQLWFNEHPRGKDPDAWLWPNDKGRHITVERFDAILKAAAMKAGIKKRVYSHLLRHSRATHLARIMTEYQLRIYFGWTKTSDVPARYVHLSGKDTDEALLKHYGIFLDNEQRMCPRCGALNQPDALYCMRCSAIISVAEAQRVEEQRTEQEELVSKVVEKLISQAPDILERVLRESGAIPKTKKPE